MDPGSGHDLNGWALEVRSSSADPADTSLVAASGDGELVDLSDIAPDTSSGEHRTITRHLVAEKDDLVVARVTLRAGWIEEADAERLWRVKDRKVGIAHRVTWVLPDVESLAWTSMGASGTGPVTSLEQVERVGDDVYRVRIFHTTQAGLPPNEDARMEPEEVARHFAVFYALLGLPHPADIILPHADGDKFAGHLGHDHVEGGRGESPAVDEDKDDEFFGPKVNCGGARADLEMAA